MEIRDVLTNIKKYDAWDYKNYPLRKDEADAIIENYKEPCEDCISRKEVNRLRKYRLIGGQSTVSLVEINALPSVQPVACIGKVEFDEEKLKDIVHETIENYSRPKGEWINTRPPEKSDNIVCSLCGFDSIADYKFCPNCGASMKGET